MIIKFRLFENIFSERISRLSSVCLYLESIQPLSKEDGFIECVYEDSDRVEFTFWFNLDVSEENYEKFYSFLEKNKLKIHMEEPCEDGYEIIITLSEYRIKKYADLYEAIYKYNL